MTTPVVVIGGGVAGCAAAAALAAQKIPVLLIEKNGHVGGVAAQGEHHTVCGLAPIDAPTPSLLEASYVGPWLPYITTGEPYRHGRVWLWPTTAHKLQHGLAQRLHELFVPVHYYEALTDLQVVDGRVQAITTNKQSHIPVRAIIDASGSGISAYYIGTDMRRGEQWSAYRSRLSLPQMSHGKAARVRALHTAQQIIGHNAAIALTPIEQSDWQLSLDVALGTTVQHAAQQAEQIAAALQGSVITHATHIAVRDSGRPAEQLTLAELFNTQDRGICWAAWPQEQHSENGIIWSWPERDRYGIPPSAVQLKNGPQNLFFIGKGMPVDAAAASALRVTGTCLALGGAIAELIIQNNY